MSYPLIVPLLLILGEDTITRFKDNDLSTAICDVLFYSKKEISTSKSNSKGSLTPNLSEYMYNKNNHNYHSNRCALLCDEHSGKKENKIAEMHSKLANANFNCINDFLFLCQQYYWEMQQSEPLTIKAKKEKSLKELIPSFTYREIDEKIKDRDYNIFDQALTIAAYAADGAKAVDKIETASIVKEIRKRRECSSRPQGSIYYSNLLSVLNRFCNNKGKTFTPFELVKLTIIDPESLTLWSGKEGSHFLDNASDEIYKIVVSPEFFFSNYDGYDQYLSALPSLVNNLNEAYLCYMENQLKKISNDVVTSCAELLSYTYRELMKLNLDDYKREALGNALNCVKKLTPIYSLNDEEKTARKNLLLEMLIRLFAAVLTNNWEEIDLIPMESIPILLNTLNSTISLINTKELTQLIDGETDDEDILIKALTIYDEVGRISSGNSYLIKRFDEKYSEQFLKLISLPLAQKILLNSQNSYSFVFALYRNWLLYKKAFIYQNYKESKISMRTDLILCKVCVDYLKLYAKEKNAVLNFDIIDNKGCSKKFSLSLATANDFESISRINSQEFSRKIFVNSPEDELKFGIDNGTIWAIKDEAYNTLVAMFIIVPVENDERLKFLEGVYGTATLACEYENSKSENAISSSFVIFDAVIVDNKYRGLGFQRLGLILAEYLCKHINGQFVCATVSPANIASYRNFVLCEYKKVETVFYPSCDNTKTPGRRYKEPTDYYINHKTECDGENISEDIKSFLIDNEISEKDYREERVAIRDFMVLKMKQESRITAENYFKAPAPLQPATYHKDKPQAPRIIVTPEMVSQYQAGMIVKHKTRGNGVIISISQDPVSKQHNILIKFEYRERQFRLEELLENDMLSSI